MAALAFFPASTPDLSPAVTNLNPNTEQTALILLGGVLLLLGFFWLKKARAAEGRLAVARRVISRAPVDLEARLPGLDPVWIEVELTNESLASEVSREARITV